MKKVGVFLVPLFLFLGITVFLLQGLFSEARYQVATSVNRAAPVLDLPDVMDLSKRYTNEVFEGEVTLLNVWGVWCVTCAIELPYLTHLREQGVRILGLYYEQELDPDFGVKPIPQMQQEISEKLSQLGNPYQFNIFDEKRDYSLDLGVTGAPETFLIDPEGIIRVHHIGDVNPRVWENKFVPVYKELGIEL